MAKRKVIKAGRAYGPRRDGTVVTAEEALGTGEDEFGRSAARNPGFYVWFGMWKGPFVTSEAARQACAEWLWEAKHS